jgi:general secretion pathway protein D
MTTKILHRYLFALGLLLCASAAHAQGNLPAPASTPAAAPAPMSPNAEVNLNFPGVDVHEAAKAILGDILGLNYAVDPSVTGSVTVVTAHPVTKADVFPILEDSLKAAGLGLVRRGAVYTIVPMAEARRQPQLVVADDPGFGTEEIPLKFVNAAELKKLLDPLVPENAISQADTGRNLLMVTGSAGERRSIRELVNQFDVNWLRGMSFAMFVPHHTDSKQLLPELDQLLNSEGSPTAGLVRLIAVDRLNGILAISAQPAYLKQVRHWVEMLDAEGESSARKLFVYRVQNGRASDVATVLVNAFGGGSNKNGQNQPRSEHASRQAPIATFQSQDSSSPTSTSSLGGSAFGSSGSSGTTGGLGSQGDLISNDTFGQPTAGGSTTQTLQLSAAEGLITITSDDSNNAIVVYSTQRQYDVVADALRKLDIRPLQVVIEAAITEVTLTKQLQYGVQWSFGFGQNTVSYTEGPTSTPVQNFPGFSYLFTNGTTISATLNALASITNVKVLSAPKLLVLNNHTAALQVGDEVPIETASSSSVIGSDSPIVNSIDYLDTGVILKVTPRVNDGGLVLLDISQEVSDVAGTPPASAQIQSPTIEQRRIASSIAVQDGQTIALGGLIRDTRTDENDGVPWLKDVPLLGNLFKNTDNQDVRTELLVLLTPRVIKNPTDAQAITDELREEIKLADPLGAKKAKSN